MSDLVNGELTTYFLGLVLGTIFGMMIGEAIAHRSRKP